VQRFETAYGRLLDALALIACALVLSMTLMICADVFLRNVRIVPGLAGLEWANEISEAMLYLVTLLTAPWLLRRGQHVRLDVVLALLPPRIAWLIEALGDLLGFAVSLVLVRYGLAMAIDSARIGAITIKNLVFPEWWLLAPLPITFALLAIEFVFRFDRLLHGPRTRRTEATSVG
jgi:TRAP-type C4-dicarboxylate transport system permease small subunit